MPDERNDPVPESSSAQAAGAATAGGRSRALLLTVCGCLFVLIVGVGIKWTGERREAAECRGRLEALWSAAKQDAEARGGRLPYGPRALEGLVLRHLRHERYWNCPRTNSRYLWTSRERRLGDDPRWLLAWETVPHGWPFSRHRALFVDGRVEELSGQELKELLALERRQPLPRREKMVPKPGIHEDPAAPPPGWRMPLDQGAPSKPPAGSGEASPERTGPAGPKPAGE